MKVTVHSTVPERAFGSAAPGAVRKRSPGYREAQVPVEQAVAVALAKTARAASAPMKMCAKGTIFWRVTRVGMGGCEVFLRRDRCNPASIRSYVSMVNTVRESDGNPLRLLMEGVDGGVCVHGVRGWAPGSEAQAHAEGGAG